MWGGGTLITLAVTVGVDSAEAATFTYTVDRTPGGDVSAVGTITTDSLCTSCTSSNIVDWSIAIDNTNNSDPATVLTPSNSNLYFDSALASFSATTSELILNINSQASGTRQPYFGFSDGTFSSGPIWGGFNSWGFTTDSFGFNGEYVREDGTGGSIASSFSVPYTTSFSAAPAAQPVPEPMTILGTLAAFGFGTAFKRRQAKR